MAFFGLIKSQAARQAELKTRVRQATMKIHKFVKRLTSQADDYAALARRAHDLDDQLQFRQLVASYLQCQDGINRWQRYLIKLKTLELRQNEMDATQEFLSGMNALTSAILNGVRPEDVSAISADMEAALDRSEEMEEVLATAMEDACDRIEGVEMTHTDILLKSLETGQDISKLTDSGATESEREFWAAIDQERKNVSLK